MYHRIFQQVLILCIVLGCTCVNTQGNSNTTSYYKSGDILVEEEQVGFVRLCYILGDRELISKKLESLPDESVVIEKTRDEIQNIIKNCPTDNHHSIQKRNLDLIYPGTKWCGKGNAADNYNDLGEYAETDKCCRGHDFCPDTIKPFQSKHGLFNAGLFPKSHCDCENTFYDCLKKSTDKRGPAVGKLYFNILDFRCFELRNKRTCIKKGWWFKCKQYGYVQKMTYVPFKQF